MFLEVYVIPTNNWSGKTDDAKIDNNRRLIEMTGVRIRPTVRVEDAYADRAQLVLPGGVVLDTVGCYTEVINRIYERTGDMAML